MAWSHCTKFCCSATFKHRDSAPTGPLDLTNSIHPLLRSSSFGEGIDYSLLEMPLRLASRFLTLADVARTIVVATDGEERVHLEPDGTRRISRHSKPEHKVCDKYSEDYSDYNHWRANEILREAVGLINIVIADDDTRGAISLHRIGPHPSPLRDDQAGVPSDIIIGGYMYREMHKTRSKIEEGAILNGQERAQLLYCQFEFARLVVHELAHSIETLYTGVSRWEAHYEENPLSERGYDMEAAIFGGRLVNASWSRNLLGARAGEYCIAARRRSQPTIPAVLLYPWPSQTWLDMYRFRKEKMGVREMHRVPPTTISRVPFAFIQCLFSNDYWDAVLSSRQKSLIVPSLEERWGVYWSDADNGIRPWLTLAEPRTRPAANDPPTTATTYAKAAKLTVKRNCLLKGEVPARIYLCNLLKV